MDQQPYRPSHSRWPLITGLSLAGLLVAGALLYRLCGIHPPTRAGSVDSAAAPKSAEEVRDELSAGVVKEAVPASASREKAYAVPNRPDTSPASAQPATSPALPATAARSQELIQRLAQVDPNSARLSPEQATQFKDYFKDLVGQGPAAIPAIREFLDRNQDVSLDEAGGGSQVGYSSLRAGLFDTLRQIGSSEALDLFTSTLRNTADPAEIATIARYLDEMAPGQFHAEALKAARETLDLAAHGQVQVRDTGALFEVLQSYGDASVASQLNQATPQWRYYATMALAGLAEGQGISPLAQRVQQAAGSGRSPDTFDLQMLAQMAAQYPEAATALVEQAQKNQIPEGAWTKIAEGLAGNQYQLSKPPSDGNNATIPFGSYHVQSGNQNYYSVPFNVTGTPEQAAQRQSIVDQLLAATQNPAALRELQNARSALSKAGR